MIVHAVRLVSVSLAALLLTTVVGQAAKPAPSTLTIRGQKLEIHYDAATGERRHQKVLFVPGARGLHGWATTIAQTMATWGYDVYGLDTKTYLDAFTGTTTLTEADVANDFRQIAEWMTGRSGERVTLIGWSEGAGLAVLGAAGADNKKTFAGLIAFGLGDQNAITWHWSDNLASLIRKPNERTFRASDYMAKVTPLPLLIIQSSHDQDVPLDEAKRLFALAHDPKRFVVVDSEDHRFDGNHEEFFRTLRDGLQWMWPTGPYPGPR